MENKFIFLLSQEDKEVNKVLAACIHGWLIIREELHPSQNKKIGIGGNLNIHIPLEISGSRLLHSLCYRRFSLPLDVHALIM